MGKIFGSFNVLAATEFVRNMRYYSHVSDEYCIMILSHDSGDTHYPAAQDPSV